jgi:hypothetical protein
MSYTSIDDLQLTDYSEKSVVVTGNTREYKEDLKAYGGKWNGRLRNGPGWIFPKHKKGILEKWLETGQRIVEDTRSKVSVESSQVTRGPVGDLGELVRRMDKMESKLDMIIEMMSQNMKIDMKSMSEEVKNISRELEIESDGSSDIVFEEEEEIVMKRLLR